MTDEAFKREVSDAVEEVMRIATKANFACERGPAILEVVSRFILPKPVDPLVEAYQACFPEDTGIPSICAMLQAEITKRGGRIVWENEP